MKLKILLLVLLISVPVLAGSGINPKAIDYIKIRIVQDGVLDVQGDVISANLTMFIPQEGVLSQDISSDGDFSYSYVYDEFGNKKLVILWNKPTGIINYKITTVVENRAKSFNKEHSIADTDEYLDEIGNIIIDDDIRKMAFPYEKTWKRVAELTMDVHNLMTYDISMVGQRKSSVWALENKQGVCVEYTNLLTALLRAAGIPTRYVTGYAYSVVDDRMIGHTWVEVLDSKGDWIAFDPTWLEGGYLDATHIRTGGLLDDNQSDVLTYFGTGKILWKRGGTNVDEKKSDLYADNIEILDMKMKNLTDISISGQGSVAFGEGIYLKSSVDVDTCAIHDLRILSCVDDAGKSVFDIKDSNQIIFACGYFDTMWFLKEASGGKNPYMCPVTVFDQFGAQETIVLNVKGKEKQGDVFILGPDTVEVGEEFTLVSSMDNSIFYSEYFGKYEGKEWQLKINKPGVYNFTLYANNDIAYKSVYIVDKKEFDIALQVPKNITVGSFIAGVFVTNLADDKVARIEVTFDGQMYETSTMIKSGEVKSFSFNLTADKPGIKKISVSVIGDSITSKTLHIDVRGKSKGFFEMLLMRIKDFFDDIIYFLIHLGD